MLKCFHLYFLGCAALINPGFCVDAAQAAELPGSFKGSAIGVDLTSAVGPLTSELDRIAGISTACRETNGKIRSTSVDRLSVGTDGGLLSASGARSTTTTHKTVTAADGQTTSTLTGLNLLGGLITADSVKAVADGHATARSFSGSFDGSGFVNLTVAGKSIGSDVQPNTRISLPGIGSVILKKVETNDLPGNKGAISVDMLTVNATETNGFDLPIGAKLVVAHASAGYSPLQLSAIVSGKAFASQLSVNGPSVGDSSRTGLIGLPCEGTDGSLRLKKTSAVSAGKTFSIGSAQTSVFGGQQGAATIAKTTATASGISLLSGLLTAGSAKAVAQDTLSGGKRTSSTAGSGLTNLRLAGLPLGDVTKPNRRLPLLGFGYVVLNEQNVAPSGREPISVNAVHIFITTANTLGLAVGGDLIVAHASSIAHP